jgi:methanogenic corrinoid protein MtbC1
MMGDFGSKGDYAGKARGSWRGASFDRRFQPRLASVAGVRVEDARKAKLAQTIEAEIIPRLMIAHQANRFLGSIESCGFDGSSDQPADLSDIAQFAELVAMRDVSVATSYVVRLIDQGMSVETAYLDLLAPAARRFGEQWDLDLCDFTDVGLGLARLHQVMTIIGDRMSVRALPRKARRRALLVSMRDEMHNFGLFMLASLFRRASWDVLESPLMMEQDLLEKLRAAPFHIVGISVSSQEQLDRARATIAMIRKASRNRNVKIMLGGPHFARNPGAVECGADATSANGLEAVDIANHLVKAGTCSSWS